MRKGDQWGSLTLADIYDESVTTKHNGVSETINTVMYALRCECGKNRIVSKGAFPGRRKMRDCGCGVANSDSHSTLSTYVREGTLKRIQKYGKEHNLPVSKAINRLCVIALDSVDKVA